MNERIRKLAVQRGLNGPNYLISSQELEKFAELIVRECINTVANVKPGYRDYRDQIEEAMRDDCVEALKQRFGINHDCGDR